MPMWWLSLRHLAEHRLRTALTIIGIALGVAAVTATTLMNYSVSAAYMRTIERLVGKATLQVRNGEAGVPEALLEQVRKTPGVEVVEASVQGFVPVIDHPGESLYVFGVDLLAEETLRDYELSDEQGEIEDPLVFLAQPDSVAVSTRFLETNGLAIDDRIVVRGPRGAVPLTIRAMLDLKSGFASLFGGRIAIMDVFAAQQLFALDGRFSQLDLSVREGVEPATVVRALEQVTTGKGNVEPSEARGARFERLMSAQRYAMVGTGISALLVGVILTFGTMVIAIAQRRKYFGVLRLVGMRRREVFRLLLAEAACLGIVGALLGGLAGQALARFAATGFAEFMRQRFSLAIDAAAADGGGILPLLACMALGPVCAILGAWIPARETLRLQPAEVIRPSPAAASSVESSKNLALVGLIVIAGAAVVWSLRSHFGPVFVGSTVSQGLLLGVAFISPVFVTALAVRSKSLLGRLFGPAGWLAGRDLLANLPRMSITSVMLVVSLGGAIMVATISAGVHQTMSAWLQSNFSKVDLMVSSNGRPLSPDALPFSESALVEIARLPEVVGVEGWRISVVDYGGTSIRLTAVDSNFYEAGIRRVDLLDGDPDLAVQALAKGEAVIVNGPFAGEFDAWTGSTITLPTPTGEIQFPVAGVTIDQRDYGTVYLNREVYRQRWQDDNVTLVSVALAENVNVERGAAAIRACCGERHGLFVATAADFRRELEGNLAQVLALTYPGIVVAFMIALFGMTNCLLGWVEEQVRSIGVIRAVGGTRRQVMWSLMMEAGALGFLGGLFAVLAGSVMGYIGVISNFHLFHMTLLYRFPVAEVVFAIAASAVLSAAAGYLPGRRAARVNLMSALSWE